MELFIKSDYYFYEQELFEWKSFHYINIAIYEIHLEVETMEIYMKLHLQK